MRASHIEQMSGSELRVLNLKTKDCILICPNANERNILIAVFSTEFYSHLQFSLFSLSLHLHSPNFNKK